MTDLAGIEYTPDLVAAITRRIREGELAPGDRLPSIRELARTTGLSPGSVASAMRTLTSRGLIVSTQGRRSTVADLARLPVAYNSPVPAGLTDLSRIEPDPALLPDVASALDASLYEPSMYDATNVVPELDSLLRERFAGDGVHGPLTVTNGALDALERILQARVHPGEVVLVEDPCWTTQQSLLRILGLETVGVEIDDEGMRPEALLAALEGRRCAALIHTPRGQNPTGANVSPERARRLRAVLGDHPDVLVIEDDHLSAISAGPYETLTTGRAYWAVVRSFSKAIGPDLRLAACAMDEETTDRVQLRQLMGPGWVSHLTQRLVARVLGDPVARDRIERAADVYRERRELLLDALGRAGIDARGSSGFTVFIPLESEMDVVVGLSRKGWAVQAGEPYRIATAPFIRVCVSTIAPTEILAFASDLAEILTAGRRSIRR